MVLKLKTKLHFADKLNTKKYIKNMQLKLKLSGSIFDSKNCFLKKKKTNEKKLKLIKLEFLNKE